MKPVDVKDNTFINFGKNVKEKDPIFEVGDHLGISKYKKFLLKATIELGQKKFL